MPKDPAFLFYYQDFMFGTTFMTNEQRGAYIALICHAADKGTLTEAQMKIICSSQAVFDVVSEKFIRDENGRYYHKRVRDEISKRRNFVESRRLNRKTKGNMSSSYDQHMENENEDDKSTPHGPNNNNVPQPVQAVFDLWNAFAGKHTALRQAKVLNKTRRDKIRTRLKEELFDFKLILRAIEQQTFLIKGNPNSEKHSNWRVDLDWIIHNDTNYIKILEFKYADPSQPMPTKSRSQLEWEKTQKYLKDLERGRND